MAQDPYGIRPNEVAVNVEPRADATVQFIGRIHTPYNQRSDCPHQAKPDGPICQIEVFAPWDQALLGLERFERIEVLYWLDKSRRDLVVQAPRHSDTTYGTFALRSPVRPNPIGTAVVRLEAIEGNLLSVRSLDCLDGTPLIDLKPDRCAYTPKAAPSSGDLT
ncbi:MAG: tRNA (N6-threonylcarbamoyladenosine(37)-N6)-methyltransferase TrmO [Pseudomonadota bacterium]